MIKQTAPFLLLLVAMCFVSCREASEPVDQQIVLAFATKNHMDDTVVFDSINKIYFSRIQSKGFGMFYEFIVPEPLQDKHYDIVFEGRVRSNYAQSRGAIVFTAHDNKKNQLCWWSTSFVPHLKYLNQWNHFKDSLHIPGLINDVRYTSIRAFPFLGETRSERLDIDTFKVTLKKRQVL